MPDDVGVAVVATRAGAPDAGRLAEPIAGNPVDATSLTIRLCTTTSSSWFTQVGGGPLSSTSFRVVPRRGVVCPARRAPEGAVPQVESLRAGAGRERAVAGRSRSRATRARNDRTLASAMWWSSMTSARLPTNPNGGS